MSREYDVVEVDYYKGVQLQDHNGTFGLLAMDKRGGEHMVHYKQWVFLGKYVKGKNLPSNKTRPMAVRLGDKETAVRTLKEVLRQLEE